MRFRKKIQFSGPNTTKPFTTSARQCHCGGLFLVLEHKSASKALKTCFFAYLSCQWGGLEPPLGYATGQRYRRMEDQQPRPGVGTYLGTRLRKELKLIVKMQKCLKWETRLSKEVYCNSNVSQTGSGAESPAAGGYGGWGQSPQPLGNFL